ncbi:MAG: NMD3-related protein [Methanomassiliicoccaceae archaeon]|nr:NMD3-related protein [Methanomassiliicoccaceae archaeon]
MFCVRCGKEGDTFNGLCTDCFLDGKQLVTLPHHVDLERCVNCEEFRIHNRWVPKPAKEAAEDAAMASLSAVAGMRIINVIVSSEEQDERNFNVSAEITGELGGRTVSANAGTVVRMKNNVCQRCSRQLGNYYEAIIQIRSGTKELDVNVRDETVRYVRDRIENMSSSNRQIFLTKVEEVHGGVDMYVSSTSLGKMLAKELSDTYGAETKESSKLVGKTEDGSDMYRMTYLVRMPEYHLNDIVVFEDDVYKLSGIGKGSGKLIRLRDLREMPVRRAQMSSLKVHTPHDKIMRATVVSTSRDEMQVLHPVNYSTVDIKVPANTEANETVDVADVDGTLFFVP